MKKSRGRQRTQFKRGHIPHNKGKTFPQSGKSESMKIFKWKRLESAQYSLVTKHGTNEKSVYAPDTEGAPSSVRLLRPQQKLKSEVNQESNVCLKKKETVHGTKGTRTIDNHKMVEMWNDMFKCHGEQKSQCEQLFAEIHENKKWGSAWKYKFKCKNCDFISQQYKAYEEIQTDKPGPNPAAINYGLAVGMQDTPMGVKRTRLLLNCMNIPAPAKSSLQRTTNKISEYTDELNKADMREKIELVKKVNMDRGNDPNVFNISIDGRYNTTTIASRKKPGQNASQLIGIATENITDKQYIIASYYQNQLCWTGAWLKGKGFNVECPGGHEGCTANISQYSPLSEEKVGYEIGQQLILNDVLVRYVTTDGDSRSSHGIDRAMKLLEPLWKCERLADPTHLAQSQFRQSQRASFSDEMFPGRTREMRKSIHTIFSRDIKARCSCVMKALNAEYSGDVNEIRKHLPNVLVATLKCYSGDCSMCRRHSMVCSGGVVKNWWYRSIYLGPYKITNLNMNENDMQLVRELLKMRLSIESLDLLKLNSSTQKCESTNRSINIGLQKSVNYSRNIKGRLASAIHARNNGPGTSLIEKTKNVGVKLCDDVVHSLHQFDNEFEYHKEYEKNKTNINRRLLQLGNKFYHHRKNKETKNEVPDYQKGQLDPVLEEHW